MNFILLLKAFKSISRVFTRKYKNLLYSPVAFYIIRSFSYGKIQFQYLKKTTNISGRSVKFNPISLGMSHAWNVTKLVSRIFRKSHHGTYNGRVSTGIFPSPHH